MAPIEKMSNKRESMQQQLLTKNNAYREIRAIHDKDTIRVYQAYNDKIANLAIEANSFEAPLKAGVWSSRRMTWIKPSKVWMAYRCGWTVLKNDPNQTRVLALDVSRSRFEELMMQALLTSHDSKNFKRGRKCRNSNVVVQWDPERVITIRRGGKTSVFTKALPDVRSIQIGLRGDGVQALLDPTFVLKISDVTEDFRNAVSVLLAGECDGSSETGDQESHLLVAARNALWPKGECETVMKCSDELSEILEMDFRNQSESGGKAALSIVAPSQRQMQQNMAKMM
mmetsp:Transcript_2583/g.4024  ORF Transcript_2583/g.4024 Transcript_2583/m.4024 type:complete len:284 (-) Transcript_2583:1992-2843(-)